MRRSASIARGLSNRDGDRTMTCDNCAAMLAALQERAERLERERDAARSDLQRTTELWRRALKDLESARAALSEREGDDS